MSGRIQRPLGLRVTLAFAASAALLWGCASGLGAAAPYSYFERPDPADPWSAKISGWQWRERAALSSGEASSPAAVAGSAARASAPAAPTASGESVRPDLRVKYAGFRAQQKRAAARKVADWIQEQAREHYVEDGPVDHWATLAETLHNNGDDCDGLELLVYHLLRDTGFRDDEIFRAIVFRPSDGQHHMVTLWFEDRDDPWVIDPTGAMTSGLTRMSALPLWVPLKIFSEGEEFTVRRARGRDAVARASLDPAATRGD